MSSNVNILGFAGSLRAKSLNKLLLRTAVQAAEAEGASVTTIDLADYPMPVYDGDLEAKIGLPENVEKLKALFMSHNGLLIAAPEYNSSITAALKNIIECTVLAGDPVDHVLQRCRNRTGIFWRGDKQAIMAHEQGL